MRRVVTESDRLRLAVFIDFDNIEIGVKNTLGASFDAGLVLEALKERGEVVSKTAYSDWQRAGGYSRALTQHAIRMVQRNLTPGGDKNGADINLALDALEMAFTHPHINAFVIVGGDSDFISLVEKLKQYDKKIFIVGGRQFTSGILQRNCHEFIAYENLVGASASAGRARGVSGRDVRVERAAIEQAVPLVTRALKVLSEREVSPQLGLLKSTLLQLDSTFSERSYGAGSFRDFVQKLEKAGVLRVHQAKGGWLVAPADGPAAPAEATPPTEEGEAAPVERPRPEAPRADSAPQNGRPGAPIAALGAAADGMRELRRILESAQIKRWPMYLRNVKQVLRQTAPAFDERAYGFANLVDLLRAAHKDGLVRVDRDRQGVIRIFQGSLPSGRPSAASSSMPAAAAPATPGPAGDGTDREPAVVVEAEEIPAPVELIEAEAVEVEEVNGNVATTSEQLKPRRRRGGGQSAPPSRAPRARRSRKPAS
jgi:uncharacterized LabA/DUF88 family protein